VKRKTKIDPMITVVIGISCLVNNTFMEGFKSEASHVS